ncbi:SPIRE2 [Cordylochernes scorpioides]|uniref:SPIRE2 n=1 Tax=Cordylochernes scorpioides TaxID=51811 RepID=A0ABY6LI65_9ARAC|nr:SPIRE2 [Cordylochernes scorpioides]
MKSEEKKLIQLDGNGSIRLLDALKVTECSLSEEQIWAVCYGAVRCLQMSQEVALGGFESILVDKDGNIHLPKSADPKKKIKESEILVEMGLIIFEALDYAISVCGDKERVLSSEIENLIDRMTGPKGIEKSELTANEIIKICEFRLSNEDQPDLYYMATLRSLVADMLEMNSFIKNTHQSSKSLEINSNSEDVRMHNETLFKKWDDIIMKVKSEIRECVKVIENNLDINSIKNIFNIVIDDIRCKRYKLKPMKKITTDSPPKRRLIKADPELFILEDLGLHTRTFTYIKSDKILRIDDKCSSENSSENQKSLNELSTSSSSNGSLTFDEISHIRQEMMKGELSSVSKSLYIDMIKENICFCCKKSRFSFYSNWKYKCSICTKAVCSKCYISLAPRFTDLVGRNKSACLNCESYLELMQKS